jgi:hypothetical protein
MLLFGNGNIIIPLLGPWYSLGDNEELDKKFLKHISLTILKFL